jgi:hypothetical protein
MAIFPQGLTQIDQRCTAGERRLLHQLKRCLEDDYLVWHDIPVGPKARQPDFVVLSPRWGVLLLEVKDWKRSRLLHATRDAVVLQTERGRVTLPHPMRQARDYAMELVDCMQRDPLLCHEAGQFQGKLLFPYGWGVVMQGLRAADVEGSDFAAMFPPVRTLLRDDLDEGIDAATFQRRLWGMFTVQYPHTLSLPQRDRIRWHLFPEVRLQQQAALDFEPGAAPSLPDLLQVMDLQQEQIARSMGEGHRVIHGAAGSGKTMILIYRAQVLAAAARADQPVLVLCFNRTLAGRIDAMLRQRGVDERVQVRTFHSWCADLVRSYQLDMPQGLRDNAYYDALAQVVERAVETGRVPGGQYTALLIDEAHDFEDAWLRIARRMVSPQTNSLLVLYDDAQSIYQKRRRKFNFASVGIEARGRTSVLRLNYRNTAEVMSLAVLCARELLQERAAAPSEDELQLVQPASAGRHGAMPVFIDARDEREEAELLAERVAAAHAAGTPLGEIAVLCRAKWMMPAIERALTRRGLALQSMATQAPRQFNWRSPAVRLLTLHSAKGLEFPLVFVAGLQALPVRDESVDEALRLLYVGMTRATHELVLSAHGSSPVVLRVRQALQQVSRQFSVAA